MGDSAGTQTSERLKIEDRCFFPLNPARVDDCLPIGAKKHAYADFVLTFCGNLFWDQIVYSAVKRSDQ